MRIKFRIGDVFPSDDAVSQFLTGLCLVVNDVTLVFRHMDRIHETPEGMSRVNTYYLYQTCAYYREAAHFLQQSLKDSEVERFLAGLSADGLVRLEILKDSFTPWEGSFVHRNLKPIRDVVFHYKPLSLDGIAPFLAKASADEASIEFGEGRYLDTRYDFADAVFEELVLDVWGRSEVDLKAVLEEMVKLVLALTYFAHESLALYLDGLGREPITVED
jgi:hypothetical protein